MHQLTNFTRHLLQQHTYSKDSLELAGVVNQLILGSKIISREVNKAGLVDITGSTGRINVQNEEIQKLDEFANTAFVELLKQSPDVKAVGSEEIEDMIVFTEPYHKDSQYIVHLDPLDGSSNIDVNVSVGTNFVIFKRKTSGRLCEKDYLQAGKEAVCAGYVVYGSSTMLVYSSGTGKGVHGFTLDPSIGEYILSHENMKYPEASSIYSINESYEPNWDTPFKNYMNGLKVEKNIKGKTRTARYIGSLVADFHRNLLKGGIFIYPADKKHPNGKLRLLFEGIPFAFLTKEAGGHSSDGKTDVLDIKPEKLHQRIPLYIGNEKDVEKAEKLFRS